MHIGCTKYTVHSVFTVYMNTMYVSLIHCLCNNYHMIADGWKIYYGEVKGRMQYIDVKEEPGRRLCPCMIYFTCSYTFNKLGAYSKVLELRYST